MESQNVQRAKNDRRKIGLQNIFEELSFLFQKSYSLVKWFIIPFMRLSPVLFFSIWFLWALFLIARSWSPEAAHNQLLPRVHTEWEIFCPLSINVQLMQSNDKTNL